MCRALQRAGEASLALWIKAQDAFQRGAGVHSDPLAGRSGRAYAGLDFSKVWVRIGGVATARIGGAEKAGQVECVSGGVEVTSAGRRVEGLP